LISGTYIQSHFPEEGEENVSKISPIGAMMGFLYASYLSYKKKYGTRIPVLVNPSKSLKFTPVCMGGLVFFLLGKRKKVWKTRDTRKEKKKQKTKKKKKKKKKRKSTIKKGLCGFTFPVVFARIPRGISDGRLQVLSGELGRPKPTQELKIFISRNERVKKYPPPKNRILFQLFDPMWCSR
jgi:hypothetical protein